MPSIHYQIFKQAPSYLVHCLRDTRSPLNFLLLLSLHEYLCVHIGCLNNDFVSFSYVILFLNSARIHFLVGFLCLLEGFFNRTIFEMLVLERVLNPNLFFCI